MNLQRYEYYVNPSYFDYEFESIGHKGKIRKIARFSSIGDNVYNLGFGDLDVVTGDISDTVISNNGDKDKVLATVAFIIQDFTERFSESVIYVKGSTTARTRWYQMNINAFWKEISLNFEIFGLLNGAWETFGKGHNYEAFLGHRK